MNIKDKPVFSYKLSTAIEFGYYGLEALFELSDVYAKLLVKNSCILNTNLSEYQFRKVRKEFHNIGIELVLREKSDSIDIIDESGNDYMILSAYLTRFKNTIVFRDTLMELYSGFKRCLERRRKLKSAYTESINNFNRFLKDKFNVSLSNYEYDYDRCEITITLYHQKLLNMIDIYKSLKDYNLVNVRFQVDVIYVSESTDTIDYVFRYRVLNIDSEY